MKRYTLIVAGAFCLFVFLWLGLAAQPPAPSPEPDAMLQGFKNPPNSARPRVWWHWMNGNITPEGIQLDLHWMSRVGLGGFTVFEGAIDTPTVVKQRLIYMTPPWKSAFSQAVSTARSLGMEVSIASSPGWSETGGPWVPPAQAMKKLVWSATRVEGGTAFTGTLPPPPKTTGTFQNYSEQNHRQGEASGGEVAHPLPQFYSDSAVIAYRLPEADKTQAELNPQVTSSGGTADVPALSDGDVDKVALALPAGAPGEDAWVQFDYGRPQTIQAITLATVDDIISIFEFDFDAPPLRLESSDDGQTFRKVTDILASSVPQRTTAFDAVTARFFRVVFPTPASAGKSEKPRVHQITELVLSSGARVNAFEKRAGFSTVRDYYAIPDPPVAPGFVIPKRDVVDLTSRMKPDGSLDWTPPPGKWMVLRMGYSLTGHQNGPAPAEATGLEVDKFNRQYVKNYLDNYLKTYSETVGPEKMGKSGIAFLLTDSTEVGTQNWTDNMLSEFRQRRGYDARLWLPALTGAIIESPAATDKFLWDFRRTIGELIAQNHYGEISAEMHRRGMGYYGEALEYHRPSLGDDMEMRTKTDIPMGAMWTFTEAEGPTPTYLADLRGAASIAHIYGQNLVGAESMTSNGPAWAYFPGNLRRIADLEFALGVNRFMIHESAHQPLVDKAPGLTLGPYGQWFNRHETWAYEAGPWVTYLARSSYLLQQGHFYGDVAYFYSEEAPLTALFALRPQPDAPVGYGYDYVNSDVILHRLSFQGGRLVTPAGTSYRLLYLGGTTKRMTLPVLRRIKELVAQGAVIAGNKPVDSPSLADNEAEFHAIADQLWGSGSAPSDSVHTFGQGKVYSGKTADEVLADLQLDPDFDYTRREADTKLLFLHRKLNDGDVYFVDNRKDRSETVDVTFRVEGKNPELWDAVTGMTSPASYRIEGGRTTVSLRLDPYESIFVVFRKPAVATSRQVPLPLETLVSTPDDSLDRNWSVSFQPGRGAPEKLEFDRLISWIDSTNEGVKYFSGSATYTKTIQAPADWFKPGAHLWLDLGDVENLADVAVNGKSLGILWKAPYKVDVSSALKPGSNQLTIKVTNLWVNRLIGDQQPDAREKYTFTDFKPYNANSPLLPSGLLGPLRVLSVKEGN